MKKSILENLRELFKKYNPTAHPRHSKFTTFEVSYNEECIKLLTAADIYYTVETVTNREHPDFGSKYIEFLLPRHYDVETTKFYTIDKSIWMTFDDFMLTIETVNEMSDVSIKSSSFKKLVYNICKEDFPNPQGFSLSVLDKSFIDAINRITLCNTVTSNINPYGYSKDVICNIFETFQGKVYYLRIPCENKLSVDIVMIKTVLLDNFK